MNNPPNTENWTKRLDMLYRKACLVDKYDEVGPKNSIKFHDSTSPETAARVGLWENALGAFFTFLETKLDTHFLDTHFDVDVIAIFPDTTVRNVSFHCRGGVERNKKRLDEAVVDLVDKMAREFGTTDTMLKMKAELKGCK